MKRILLFLIPFQLSAIILRGQEITRQESDSMIIKLQKTKSVNDKLELLLNLAQFHIFKPGENKMDLDSAAIYIEEAKAISKNIKSANADGYLLFTESCLVRERGPRNKVSPYFTSEKSKTMLEEAIKILESGTNKDYLGRACYELSNYYGNNDSLEIQKKIELLKQSAKAFQMSGDLLRKGKSLEMLAELYYVRGEFDKAIIINKEALDTYNSIHYQNLQGIYFFLGRIYFYKHDDVPALSNLLKALKTAQSVKDNSKKLCQINNFLGQLYNDIDRLDMAIKYLNEALQVARKNNDEDEIFHVVGNLSIVYNNLGQPQRSLKVLDSIPNRFLLSKRFKDQFPINMAYLTTYLELMRPDKARPFCDVMLRISDNPLDNFDLDRRSYIYAYIAKFYLLSNQYAKAHYYNMKSTALANKVNFGRVQMLNLEISYKLDSAEGNFKSAYKNLRLYKTKTDSVYSERKVRQFQVMNVEYEVGMKEDSIKLQNKDIALLSETNKFQMANLRQAKFAKNVTITGIILAFIIIALLYRQYRHKLKSNLVLQTQKEEINKNNQELKQLNEQQTKLLVEKDWLVKEIHHRVKNNLQMVVSLLNAQTEFLTHPSALEAIKESRERMQTIAIIHQKLYQLDNSTQINMRSYITELIDNIKSSFGDSERIHFKIDVADINLDISQSLPLGLILNEAITNAVKYAYPKWEKGAIQIFLKYYDNDKLQLKIADNGKGLPADVDIKQSNSLGIQLMRLFSEQLEGDLYFINNNGLEIILNFKAAGYNDIAANKNIA